MSSEPVNMSVRVDALGYLGMIAARLRKDAIAVSKDQKAVSDVISLVCFNVLLSYACLSLRACTLSICQSRMHLSLETGSFELAHGLLLILFQSRHSMT